MGMNKLLLCLFLINTAVGAYGSMHLKKTVKEKAESLYESNSLHGPSGNPKDRPVAELSTCLEEIFGVPPPYSPHGTTTGTPTTTPATASTTTKIVVPKRCIYTDGKGKPEVRPPETHRRRRDVQKVAKTDCNQNGSNRKSKVRDRRNHRRRRSVMDEEISKFHRCICQLLDSGDKCHFSLLKTGYNKTVLTSSLGAYVTNRARLTYRKTEFNCRLRADFTLVCSIIKRNIDRDNDTKLQQTLVCLSNALEPHVCDAIQTTPPINPDIPTHSPSQDPAPYDVGPIILILGCVLCLMLGILGTVCGIFFSKKIKKTWLGNVRFEANNQSRDETEYHQYEEIPETISEIQASCHSPDIPETISEIQASCNSPDIPETVSEIQASCNSPDIPDRSQDRPQPCSPRIMKLRLELDRLTEDVEDSTIDNVINVPEQGDGHYEPISDPNEDSDERQCFHAAKPEPKPRLNLNAQDRKSSGHNDFYIDALDTSDHSVGHQSQRDIYINAVEGTR